MNVVLATDGNEPARSACDLLARVAHRDRVAVQVLAVNGFETVLQEAQVRHRYDPAAGRAQAEAHLAAARDRLRMAGLRADGVARDGDPPTEIVDFAAANAAELIALGAGHTTWLDTLLLGSTSTAVLHAAAASVLVVRGVDGGAVSVRVLVGTDGSAGARRAAQVFSQVADPARCDVLVLAVASIPAFMGAGVVGDDAIGVQLHERAHAAAEDTATALRAAGFSVRSETADGQPARVLLERARDHDLVVVGSRGAGVVSRALLGSVSDKLARHARATLVGR
jgi:nucleotide-binding universal stress UspA family protein